MCVDGKFRVGQRGRVASISIMCIVFVVEYFHFLLLLPHLVDVSQILEIKGYREIFAGILL